MFSFGDDPKFVSRTLGLLFALGLLLRLAFALLPLSFHLVLLEDDAWMVAAISRNFVAGMGITADGLNPTNGFQPLYPLTIGALPWVLAPHDLNLAFTLSLVLTAVLNALVVLPLYGLARHFTDEKGALLSALLFALNPFLIRVSVNAMETSLGLLLLTVLFYAYYNLDLTRWRGILWLAVLTVFAILARLDALIAFGAISLTEGIRRLANGWRTRDYSALAGWTGYVGLVLILLAPYFYINVTQFGSIQPSSSRALSYLHSYAESFAPNIGFHILFATPALNLVFINSLLIKLLILLALAIVVWRTLSRTQVLEFVPMFLFVGLVIVYYGYFLQHNVSRYYVGIAIPLFVLIGVVARKIWLSNPRPLARAAVSVFLVALLFLNTIDPYTNYVRAASSPSLTQPAMYQAALWIKDNLPSTARLGAVNSGIYQYYSGRIVMNLDGKLNMAMVPVFEKQELLDYLAANRIEYLVETRGEIERRFARYEASFSSEPPHHELSPLDHISIYLKLVAQSVGIPVILSLDDQQTTALKRPLEDVMTVIHTIPRPNQDTNPVSIFKLR